MTEITRNEFDDLKAKVNEISSDIKKMIATLNAHIQYDGEWSADIKARVLQNREIVDIHTIKLKLHESKINENDIWKAGFMGHIKGMWFAIGTLIPVIFGIILKIFVIMNIFVF